MSRLDSFIRRLMAQRTCLNHAAEQISGIPGVIFELGLGNGRTYDHLRDVLPNREIFVFDRQVAAHPDCIPDDDHMIVGDFSDTLPATIERFEGQCALVHADIGTGVAERNASMARYLGSILGPTMAPGGLILSDQEIAIPGFSLGILPEDVPDGRYYLLCNGQEGD